MKKAQVVGQFGKLVMVILTLGILVYIAFTTLNPAGKQASDLVGNCEDETLTIKDYQENIERSLEVNMLAEILEVDKQMYSCLEEGVLPKEGADLESYEVLLVQTLLDQYILSDDRSIEQWLLSRYEDDPLVKSKFKDYFQIKSELKDIEKEKSKLFAGTPIAYGAYILNQEKAGQYRQLNSKLGYETAIDILRTVIGIVGYNNEAIDGLDVSGRNSLIVDLSLDLSETRIAYAKWLASKGDSQGEKLYLDASTNFPADFETRFLNLPNDEIGFQTDRLQKIADDSGLQAKYDSQQQILSNLGQEEFKFKEDDLIKLNFPSEAITTTS